MASSKKSSKKGSKKGSKKSAGKGLMSPIASLVSVPDATRLIAAAVERAINARTLPPPKIKGPIFVGIWFNPATKQIEVINQFE